MPSFDIVSEINKHEVTNAVDQANREVTTRFDFKDSKARFDYQGDVIKLSAQSDFQLQQMIEIIKQKMAKRGVDLGHLKIGDPVLQLHKAEQDLTLQQGISTEIAKKITKLIKEEKMKVQSAIQGDKIRISGKKRDDLQQCIALLRKTDLEIPLQFENFRD